jgi:hypothetical protein
MRVSEIEHARNAAQRILPAGIMAYVDKIGLWLKTPLPHSDLDWLNAQCRGGIYVLQKGMRFDRSYRQRLQLRQPTVEALHALAGLDGVLLNYLELALDWTFDSRRARFRPRIRMQSPCKALARKAEDQLSRRHALQLKKAKSS